MIRRLKRRTKRNPARQRQQHSRRPQLIVNDWMHSWKSSDGPLLHWSLGGLADEALREHRAGETRVLNIAKL